MKSAVCLLVLAFSSIVSVTARAQDAATIVGTVTDTSGAVVPNVNVEVANPDKGFKRILASDSAGDYVAAKVPIGSYIITAEGAGFQKLMRSGITLQVGQVLRIDLRMQVGATTQAVTIVGNVPRVETDTGTFSFVVGATQLVDLDLNGRGFLTLKLLAPGVSEANNGINFEVPTTDSIAFDGLRAYNNRTEIDGVTDVDMGNTESNAVLPSPDAIAEIRISTNNFGADMGQAGGAVVEAATKSGTREWHGGMYEFVRNTALNSNDFFANRVINPPGGNAPKVPLKWNDFGYNIGGPFYIPGVYNKDKSKTFFFWSQEFHRYVQGTVINTTVPSLLQRQGNFSQCDSTSANHNSVVAAGCILPKIPGSGGQLYPNDIVPVNPDATDLLNAFVPLPNSGPNGYISAPPNPLGLNQQHIRVDQNISDKTSAFVRYTQDDINYKTLPANNANSGNGAGQYDTVEGGAGRLTYNLAIHLTHAFTPRLMNEIILGYDEYVGISKLPTVGPSSVAGSFLKPANWTASNLLRRTKATRNCRASTSPGGTSISQGSTVSPSGTVAADSYVIKDNLVSAIGKHTLKTGFLMQRYQSNWVSGFNTKGYFFFTAGSRPLSTGNGLADMDNGAIAQN